MICMHYIIYYYMACAQGIFNNYNNIFFSENE